MAETHQGRSSARQLPRWRRFARRLWYGEPRYELAPEYLRERLPPIPNELETRREVALDFAAQEHGRHRELARWTQSFYVLLQGVTIVSASAATILNVTGDAGKWARAIPSAVAALAAGALAAFRIERSWLDHRRAAIRLKCERWAFVSGSGAYRGHDRGSDPRRLGEAITHFLDTISRVSVEGYGDLEPERRSRDERETSKSSSQ
jgi:Protein of unknown function (DUF4231)